jgi:hypothetical protein
MSLAMIAMSRKRCSMFCGWKERYTADSLMACCALTQLISVDHHTLRRLAHRQNRAGDNAKTADLPIG